jgi:hypothetical protein
MKSFDTTNGNALHAEIVRELQELADRHGIVITRNGGKIGTTEMTLGFKIKLSDPQAATDLARQEFNANAFMFGLKPEDFGAIFIAQGRRYRVTGINVSNRKQRFPIKVWDYAKGAEVLFTDMVVPIIEKARHA